MHVQPCMDEYERVQEITVGSFNLDDAVRWMCFNSLTDANVSPPFEKRTTFEGFAG